MKKIPALTPPLPENDKAPRVAPGAASGVGVVTPPHWQKSLDALELEFRALLQAHCPPSTRHLLLRRRVLRACAETHLDCYMAAPKHSDYGARERFLVIAHECGCGDVSAIVDELYGVAL